MSLGGGVYFDSRWIGAHGIGRFAGALRNRLDLYDLRVNGVPSSPLDPLRMYLAMVGLPRNAVIFSPGYNAPIRVVRPYVFTMHDLNHIDVRENSSVAKRLYYGLVLRRACHAARRVLTVSEFSRRRIIDWSGVSPDKVISVGNGVDSVYRSEGDLYQPGYPYLLSVSNRKPHKNEIRLIAAFSHARIDRGVRLLFTGDPAGALLSAIERYGVVGRVGFLGRVEEGRMPALYRGAIALAFPSLYEGFGLPVIEAMACGTPVLTSHIAAIDEVASGAALAVDPLSVEGIAFGIQQICDDQTLRGKLKVAGLRRAEDFSWDKVAGRVWAVLEDVKGEVSP